MDMVMGEHFSSLDTVKRTLYVYLNEGNDKDGNPILCDITSKAVLVPPSEKTPHIQLQDMDNDGMVDILASSNNDFVYRNHGIEGGIPRFYEPSGSGCEGGHGYWPAGPLGDFDRDGRLDFIGPEWETAAHSPLLKNVTKGAKKYIAIKLELQDGLNRNGINARVDIYEAGRLGEVEYLIGTRIITISNGYSSGYEAIAYFGLPEHRKVDIRVSMPCDGPVFTANSVKRNQMYIFK
jgi:hypothetical protein